MSSLRRLSDGREQNVATIRDADLAGSLTLSPSGDRLAMADASTLRIVDVKSGKQDVLYRVPNDSKSIAAGIPWTAAGDYLLFAERDTTGPSARLMRIPSSGGDPAPLGLIMPSIRNLGMHPTGRLLAFDGRQSAHGSEVWLVENSLLMEEAH